MSERVIMLGGDVERTPEDEYRGAAMHARETAAARNATQAQLGELDPNAIYAVYDSDGLFVKQAEIVKATPKQYKVRYLGKEHTIPRAPIDAGEIAGSYWRRFALGRGILPKLQKQLTEQTEIAERCAHRMEEKRQALQHS